MKIWVLNKKNSILIVGLCLILLVSLIAGRNLSVTVSGKNKDLPIYCVDKGEQKIMSLSFDAAWGNEDTEQLIEILNKYNVKVTFFVVGEWVDKYPESVKALCDAGHEIMNHSDTHPHMTNLTEEKMIKEINDCNDKIEKVTGIRPTLFRPPYGDYNNTVVKAVRDTGSYCIQWSIDSLDWKDLSPDEIVKRVTEKAAPGGIVLFHNAAKNTPAALIPILEKLQADGYELVPISQLIYADNYEIDLTGKQYKKSEI